MNWKLMKARRSVRQPIKVYGLSPEMRAFVRAFQAKLDGMEVIENFYTDNVVPFQKRGG